MNTFYYDMFITSASIHDITANKHAINQQKNKKTTYCLFLNQLMRQEMIYEESICSMKHFINQSVGHFGFNFQEEQASLFLLLKQMQNDQFQSVTNEDFLSV